MSGRRRNMRFVMADAGGTLRVQSDTFVRSGDGDTFVVLSSQMRSPGESLTLELADAVGSQTPAGAAGWFLVLSENPADPRFGLDPDAGGAPPTRQNLSWTHLNLPADATYAPVSTFPVVTDAAFNPATATAATMANLVRQRAFRVFLHASLLVRAPA